MQTMRESWTDERLDDFARHVDHRFDAVDRRFDAVDHRFDRVEADLRDLRQETSARFEHVETRFDEMHRTMVLLGGGAIVTIAIGFLGVIVS
jgi:hypothetical protein